MYTLSVGESGMEFKWTQQQLRQIGNLKRIRTSGHLLTPAQRVLLGSIERSERHGLRLLKSAVVAMRSGGEDKPFQATSESRISSVLIKPVGDMCNLRCTYCYEGEDIQRTRLPRMAESTLENIIRDTLAQAQGVVQFLWHGGEPTLAGLGLFQRGIEFQNQYNPHGLTILNSLQTNGTLLDKKWIDFLIKNQFSVGISLDGPQDLHDFHRVGPKNKGSYHDVVRGIQLLQDHHVTFGVIVVITNASDGRAADLLNVFRQIGIETFDIHPSFGMQAHEALHPKKYSQFVIDLFEAWLASGAENVQIGTFNDVFQALLGQSPSTCYWAGDCARIMGFEPNGDALPCTRPFDKSRYTFGNIKKQSLGAILTGDSFVDFLREDRQSQANSQNCRWYEMCHNGCPQHRIQDDRQDVEGANLYCACQSGIEGGHAAIFDHIVTRVNAILADEPDTAPTQTPFRRSAPIMLPIAAAQ